MDFSTIKYPEFEVDYKKSISEGTILNLSGADLSRADLSYANLSDANLCGADLSGADLSGADLRLTEK